MFIRLKVYLDLICKRVALRDPSLPHPGLPLLLLSRFAPITDSEKADNVRQHQTLMLFITYLWKFQLLHLLLTNCS